MTQLTAITTLLHCCV